MNSDDKFYSIFAIGIFAIVIAVIVMGGIAIIVHPELLSQCHK